MRILVDAQQLDRQMTGVGHYTHRILTTMMRCDGHHEWLALCHRGNASVIESLQTEHPLLQPVVLSEPVFGHYRAQEDLLRKLVPQVKPDVVFSPSFLAAPKDLCPSVSVVHDATYALYPEFYGRVASYLHDCVQNTCQQASHIITMSENSAKDLRQLYQIPRHRLSVIPLAADEGFRDSVSPEAILRCREHYGLPERYVLAVNMGNRKKNAPVLFAAFAALTPEQRQGAHLVVVGEWHPDALDLTQEAERAGIANQVILTGYIPQEDMAPLYAGALVFCFPSLHEGFGLPVIEAMAVGVPVLCSSEASVPEVAGDAARLIDPRDTAAWTRELAALLASDEQRQQLIQRGRERALGFTWETTAKATLAALEGTQRLAALPVSPTTRPPVFDPVAIDGLVCVITVDDVRPEPGFGGRRHDDPLGYLNRLHEEFGCKATLFTPTAWKDEWPVDRHLEWLGWLVSRPYAEIACHGHLHAAEPGSDDPGEFRGISPERLEAILDTSFAAFARVGHQPRGIRAPGWFLEPSTYAVFARRFAYVADHVQGLDPARLRGTNLLRIPYHSTIDATVPWPERGLVVLQSHIAPEGRTTNGWTDAHFQRMRAFLRTGQRLGVQFMTLADAAQHLASAPTVAPAPSMTPEPIVVQAVSHDDERLRGGVLHHIGADATVLYHGTSAPCPHQLRADNATIMVLSRNRREYLVDLLSSIDRTGPAELGRVVVLNNTEDGSKEMLAAQFPAWQVLAVDDQDYAQHDPPGLMWMKQHAPQLLPRPIEAVGPAAGWTAPRSISWLRNCEFRTCDRDFLLHFDDDFVVKDGWWDYYQLIQRTFSAHGVFNNFGAFVMCRTIWEQIGMCDERFLGSHGYEDLDLAARIAEGRMRWALGFNRDHDWRSAEQGNPRGSMTGNDLFVHRYALMSGGFSARRDDWQADPIRAQWNGRWWAAKWEETQEDTGIIARPPFAGKFLRRRVPSEPTWPLATRSTASSPAPRPMSALPGVKLKENTPVDEIDPVANPVTGTMVDRYAFAAHWCKGKRVIDAACGYGYGSVMLLALGAEQVIGLDLEDDGLAWARSRYAGPRVSYERFDLTAGHPFPGGAAEVVVSIETMEHLPREHCERYLATLRRLTEPGGTVFITTPRRTEARWVYRGGTHRYEYSPDEFRQLITQAFPGSRIGYHGIEEFHRNDEPRLYSRWTDNIDERTRIMIAIVDGVL